MYAKAKEFAQKYDLNIIAKRLKGILLENLYELK